MKTFAVVDKGCLDIVIIFIRLGQQRLIKSHSQECTVEAEVLMPIFHMMPLGRKMQAI